MSISFSTLSQILPLLSNSRKPILLRGRHGIGKSQVVFQFAESIGLPVVDRRASQMTEGDLLGLPKQTDSDTTEWCPPTWFKTACTTGVVLFLDEVDRATLEVRQGIFELCDSRKLAGNALHPDTLVVACVNGGEDGEQYQVGEMDPAELDRWTTFDLAPTVEDWLSWADGNVVGLVWDFINDNHTHLEHKDDFEPNKKYPSRRSWVRLSETLRDNGLESPEDLRKLKGTGVLYALINGFVGFEGATAMCDYLENYNKLVTVKDILDGKVKLVKDFSINDHNALIERFKQSKVFGTKLTEKQFNGIARYFMTMPSEIAMHFFQAIVPDAMEADSPDNISSLYATEVNGKSVREYVVEILSPKV
jgi:hypothetical protein